MSNHPHINLPGRIAWKCHTCGDVITAGAIHIDLQAVRRAEQALAAQEKRTRGEDVDRVWFAELLLGPRIEQWRVDCNTCCHGCVGCYSIDLRQCQTIYALVRWTEHLYGKNWFNATNWIYFIAEVARQHGSVSEPTGVA